MNDLLYNFVDSKPSHLAYLLHGEWGSGKTFFIKEFFLPKTKAKHKYYISLFGVSNIDEIYNQLITQKFISEESGKFLKFSFVAASVLMKSASNFFKKKANLSNETVINPLNLIPVNDCVIIFDDLERISEQANISELLGQINTYFISKESIRVIFVADEDKITNPVFAKYKEKVVGFQSTLEIDTKQTLISIAERKENEKFVNFLKNNIDFIYDMVNTFEIQNLRTVSYYFDVLNVFYTENLDSLISKKDLLYSVFALTVEEKANRLNSIRKTADIPEFITREFGNNSITLRENKLESYFNRYIVTSIRKIYNYSFNYYYYQSIFNVIRFGKLDKKKIQKEINQIEQYKKKEQKSKLVLLIERLRGYYHMTNKEFLNVYSEFTEELKKSATVFQFDELVMSCGILYYLKNQPELKIEAHVLIVKYIEPELIQISEKETIYYPFSILSRLKREIAIINTLDQKLAKRLNTMMIKFDQKAFSFESNKKIKLGKFKEIEIYDFRFFLIVSSSSEIIKIINNIKETKGKLEEFTLKLEKTLKAPIGSINEISKDDELEKLSNLTEKLSEYQKSLEHIEKVWVGLMIKALNEAITIHNLD